MNANELVGALRSCNNPKGRRCSSCPVFSRYDHKECKRAVDILAADAIEKLQAETTQLKDELADYNCDTKIGCKLIEEVKAERDAAVAENERLAKHGGKYIQLSDERYKMYEKAVKRAEDAEIKLAESQRMERAAVEGLEWLAGTTVDSLRCNICKYNPNDMGCELDGSQFDDDGECHFTWCGPQEAEKGDKMGFMVYQKMTNGESQNRSEELKEASLPLLNYLNKYYHPHCYAVVTEGRIEIVEGKEACPLPIRD